jgi:hypothetical protein
VLHPEQAKNISHAKSAFLLDDDGKERRRKREMWNKMDEGIIKN